MIRIALFGQKENGKTTAAKLIRDKIFPHKNIHIGSFAQPIYETLSSITGLPLSFLRENKETKLNNHDKTIREGLQILGEAMRQWDKDIWVKLFNQRSTTNYIIDDGRYENEVANGKKSSCVNILMVRPEWINTDPHSSESWLADIISDRRFPRKIAVDEQHKYTDDYLNSIGFDYYIINYDGITKLYDSLDTILNHLHKWK